MNWAASAPPLMLYTGTPPSTLLEVTVVTTWMFSATLTAAVAPPPLLVRIGASLTGVPNMSLLPVRGAATPSLTLVAIVKLLS